MEIYLLNCHLLFDKTTKNELIICLKSLMILSDLANRLTKMIFKETVDRMNRWAIMGFMGMTDGGRIKVTVNCRGSAKFMGGGGGRGATMQICWNKRFFLFQVSWCRKQNNQQSQCEPGLLEVLLFNKQSRRSCNYSARPEGESAVEEVHSHQITLIPTLREVYGWSYQ